MPDTTTDGADPRMPGPELADLGVPAYLGARGLADDAVVRAAFDDLRERVRTEVRPPPAAGVVRRAQRARARAAGSKAVVAAAAALVIGAAVTLVSRGADTDAVPAVATEAATSRTASTARTTPPTSMTPTTSTRPPSVTTMRVDTALPRPPRTTAPRTTAPRTTAPRTTAPSSPDPTVSTETMLPALSSSAPSTEVIVYLWRGTPRSPDCLTQHAVTRQVTGAGGWATAVRETLAGTTAQESAQGYVSPFGAGVQADVDEATHTVNLRSRAFISDADPACRSSLAQIVGRTATDAGSPATILLEGSSLTWLAWTIGLG